MDWLERILRPLRTGVVTSHYPGSPPLLAPAARGLPVVDPERCTLAGACVTACPTGAITAAVGVDGAGAMGGAGPTWTLDAGRCVFCGACERACPTEAIRLGDRVELAVRERDALVARVAVRGPER